MTTNTTNKLTTNTPTTSGPVLVVGGTGKTGRRVAARLAALDVPVRIGSRRGTPRFEWDDAATWAPAIDGTVAAYVAYAPDLAIPGAADSVAAFSDLARRLGVRRLVLLSGRGEDGARAAEEAVQRSGLAWTVVRASWFSQNFSEDYLLEPVLSGEIALPAGDVAEPFVDADDIAEIATAALLDDRHAGQLYETTGPRLLTFDDAVNTISAAVGRDIRYTAVTAHEYEAGAIAQGVPAEHAAMLTELFTAVLDGRNARLGDGVERALGRPPRDFTDYVRETAATGVWRTADRTASTAGTPSTATTAGNHG